MSQQEKDIKIHGMTLVITLQSISFMALVEVGGTFGCFLHPVQHSQIFRVANVLGLVCQQQYRSIPNQRHLVTNGRKLL